MITAGSMSEEEFHELAEEIRAFLFRVLRREPSALASTAFVCVLGAIFGLLIGALIAAGQIAALGLQAAWTAYGIWWLFAPIAGLVLPIVIFLVCFFIFPGGVLIETAYRAVVSEPARKKISYAVLFVFFGLSLIGALATPIFMGFEEAKRKNPIVASSSLPSLRSVDEAMIKQSEALKSFTNEGKGLLRKLDGVRAELSQSLATAETQLKNSESTSSQISNLLDQQRQIESRMTELQSILGGAVPITKADLDDSSRSGLIMGAVLGFGASLAASFVYSWIARYRRGRARKIRPGVRA